MGGREANIHCISGRSRFLADMFSITTGEYCAVQNELHQQTHEARSDDRGGHERTSTLTIFLYPSSYI